MGDSDPKRTSASLPSSAGLTVTSTLLVLLCPALLLQVNENVFAPVPEGANVSLAHALFAGIVLLPFQLPDAQQEVGVFLTDHDNLIESPEVMVDLSVFRNTSGADIGADLQLSLVPRALT